MERLDTILLTILEVSAIGTVILPIYVIWGLWKHSGFRAKPKSFPFLSVVVAAHDEAENIEGCVRSILTQNYARESFEVIVVNDRSCDGTAAILESLRSEDARLNIVTIDETDAGWSPKKFALQQGITAARSDVLVFTDADCVAEPDWLTAMAGIFANGADAAIGYATPRPAPGFVNRLHRFETYRTAALMFGFALHGRAYMCTGRSWGYRRELFERIGGFDSIREALSGDDDLLLQRFMRGAKPKVKVCWQKNARVWTDSPKQWSEFVAMKMRHFSAAKFYPTSYKILFSAAAISTLVTFVLAIICATRIDIRLMPVALIPLWLYSGLIDEVMKKNGAMRTRDRLFAYIFELIYVTLYSVIGIAGVIRKPQWK